MDEIVEHGSLAKIDLHRMKAFGRLLDYKDLGDSYEYRKQLALASFEIACVTTGGRNDNQVILTEEFSKLIPLINNEVDYSYVKTICESFLEENLANNLLGLLQV